MYVFSCNETYLRKGGMMDIKWVRDTVSVALTGH